MVITGLTRNFTATWSFRPPKILVKSGVYRVRKPNILVVLSVCSFQNLFLSKKVPERRRLAYTETYRSGHNGTDSKSVEPQGSVGSNPTVSANGKANKQAGLLAFLFFCHHLKITPKIAVLSIVLERTDFVFYGSLFSLFVCHLLSKPPAPGSTIPFSIACAEDSLEE